MTAGAIRVLIGRDREVLGPALHRRRPCVLPASAGAFRGVQSETLSRQAAHVALAILADDVIAPALYADLMNLDLTR